MKSVNDVKESILSQQRMMLTRIWNTIWDSGDLRGIPQWRDRNKLYKLTTLLNSKEYLLTYKDFQFLDSLYQKYKN